MNTPVSFHRMWDVTIGFAFRMLIVLSGSLFFQSCIDPYKPPVTHHGEPLLVIDAKVNAITGVGVVKLRYSSNLDELINDTFSDPAIVSFEDEQENIYPLMPSGNGEYVGYIVLNPGDKIRLNVNVNDKEYQSDYVTYKVTPPIDSLTWTEDSDGVLISVTTHDPDNNSVYYKWEYEETWEFAVPYPTKYFYNFGNYFPRTDPENFHVCYKWTNSSNIIVATTESLKEDIVYKYPIIRVAPDQRLSRRYSVLVRQQVLQKEAYDYWRSLRQTNEDLGGLFDPQPYAIKSNIRNIDKPNEIVLGYFQVYSEVQKRLFIRHSELTKIMPGSGFSCELDTILLSDPPPDPIAMAMVLVYDAIISETGGIEGYLITHPICADCKLTGSIAKPSFW